MLEKSLDPGFSRLNWHSLGIHEFIQQCNKAITHFNTIVSQVHKSSRDVEIVLSKIMKSELFDRSETLAAPKEFESFVDSVGSHIDEVIECLVEKTKTIPSLLKKVRVEFLSHVASAMPAID